MLRHDQRGEVFVQAIRVEQRDVRLTQRQDARRVVAGKLIDGLVTGD